MASQVIDKDQSFISVKTTTKLSIQLLLWELSKISQPENRKSLVVLKKQKPKRNMRQAGQLTRMTSQILACVPMKEETLLQQEN